MEPLTDEKFAVRHHRTRADPIDTTSERNETRAERADRNWSELLQELRVSQTGVQLLTAFLLSLPLQQRFTQLSTGQRAVYLVAVCLSVLATGLLVAPVAVHRAVFRHHEKAVLVTVGDRVARAGLAMLALAVSDVLVLIFSIVVGTAAAVTAGCLSVALLGTMWWWLPHRVLTQHAGASRRSSHGSAS